MAKHRYPRELYGILRRRWNGEAVADGWPRVDLPDKPVLNELLDVCYHASLLTEEGRPTVFRVAFTSGRPPQTSPQRSPVALDPIMHYTLDHPVPFTVAELRRLAPVADPRRVLIAVEQTPGSSGPCLKIYGLIDVGMALWEMARHERNSGIASPDAVVVSSTRPGELSISRGDHPVIRLRGGQIVNPTGSVLFRGPIAHFFVKASDELIQEACARSGVQQDPEKDDTLASSHLWFIDSILLYAAELGHGGALLFIPDAAADDDAHLRDTISIKYRLSSTRPRDALLMAMAARLQHNALHRRLNRRSTLKQNDFRMFKGLGYYKNNLEDSSRDAARFISSLTAVDGAVVLTDKLRLIGFGGEIRATKPGADTIHVANTESGDQTTSVPFTAYGTRHRSAFRFVENMVPSVAFILSQDGGTRATMKVGENIIMWPYFEIGYTTALS